MEIKDEDSIRRAVSHSNIVINLIGRGVETSNFSYEDVNITAPQTIARLCKEAGVKRLVHMSHINAREEPEKAFLPGGSRFLKTKFMGELAVRFYELVLIVLTNLSKGEIRIPRGNHFPPI
jgi:NADH dehydrogenase (ubiquinone) 1 alpha subcomplex subunit 9